MNNKKHSTKSEFLKKCFLFAIVILIHWIVYTILQHGIYQLIGQYFSSVFLSLFFTLSISIVIKEMFDCIPKKNNAKILAEYFNVSIPYLLGLDETPTLKDSDSTQDNLELSNLTLFQKISLNQDASNAFEDIIYSIHLLSERDDKHSKLYIRSVTNYILTIISSKSSSLGNKSPFHRTEKAEFEYEYQKYILPFEKAVLKIEVNLKEEKSID